MSLKEDPCTAEMPTFQSSLCLPTALSLSGFRNTFLFPCLFFLQCGLFCFAFISYDCTAASGMMVVTNDFEIICKEVAVV